MNSYNLQENLGGCIFTLSAMICYVPSDQKVLAKNEAIVPSWYISMDRTFRPDCNFDSNKIFYQDLFASFFELVNNRNMLRIII